MMEADVVEAVEEAMVDTYSNNNLRPVCRLCGRVGHLAIKCFDRLTSNPKVLLHNRVKPLHIQLSLNNNLTSTLHQGEEASQEWFLDRGATHHVTSDLNNIKSDYKGMNKLVVGNDTSLPILHIGNYHLNIKQDNMLLNNILHVPNIKKKSY